MALSLLGNILLMYAVLVGVNLPAPFLGLEFGDNDKRRRLPYEPPGFVIPVVWFVLFTLLGIARHLFQDHPTLPGLIVALAFVCASYAYYTLGLAKVTKISALWFGLAGNLVVILFAGLVSYLAAGVSLYAALLIFCVVLWTAFATLIVVGEMKVQGLV
jgi:tryptophan-rich sensory protein